MPSVERSDPPYLQVAAAIRADIASGTLAEGQVVPSARQLAVDWGISSATAMKALAELRREGVVIGRPGVGTVVTSRTTHRSPQDFALAVHRTGKIYPEGHYAQVAVAELVTPGPERLVSIFGLSADDGLIRRQRTTYNPDDEPVSTSTSWFDGALQERCPLLLSTERIRQGTVGYVAEQTGRRLHSGHDWFTGGTADAESAAALGVEVGSAVMLTENRWLDQDEKIMELGESVSQAGLWAFYSYLIEGST